jgi:hypothetical protein
MNTATKLVALALLGCACGPGLLIVDSGDETSSNDSTTSSSSSSSETSTSTSTSTSEETDPGESWVFVPEHDVFELHQCDSFAQDCPGGEKCVPYSSTGGTWDANKCVPVLGDQAVGEPCTYGGVVEATDDCDATSHCWDVMDVDGEAIGTCMAFCMGTPDMPECPEGSQCLISSDSAINLCIGTCDPILQDCNDGLACFWTYTEFRCVFTTENLQPGEPCSFINDCVQGNICIPADVLPSCANSACCSPFCDLELGDQPCEVLPGTACVPFFEEGTALPGYEHVGVCIVPP